MGLHFNVSLRSCAAPPAGRRLLMVGTSWLVLSSPCFVALANDNATSDQPAPEYSVRLSVINGGAPRGAGQTDQQNASLPANVAEPFTSERPELDPSRWRFAGQDTSNDSPEQSVPSQGTPIAGDFNGDGKSEIGFFVDGQWFIDLNGNGQWDQSDLWALLGQAGDQPVVGDWDGDGKADIGVFGLDPSGKENTQEAGLPDANNDQPSGLTSATSGDPTRPTRLLKRGVDGAVRSDAVEHVLFYGSEGGKIVAGDFNGDGIDTFAIFRDGRWLVDVDGDGQFTTNDYTWDFGQAGDLPVVGDFNSDGSDDLGVYRDGLWLFTDGDGEGDIAFQLGSAKTTPVVGDWDGDGQDEGAVYLGW